MVEPVRDLLSFARIFFDSIADIAIAAWSSRAFVAVFTQDHSTTPPRLVPPLPSCSNKRLRTPPLQDSR